MKNLVVLLLSVIGAQALASEEPEVPRPKRNIEEVVVIGYRWQPIEATQSALLMMGINGEYLIHEYDKERNEWKFVRSSKDRKKDS